jgi:predicted Zn-dependent peptidase
MPTETVSTHASRIEIGTLACGMPLIVERIPGVRSVSFSWLIPAGVAFDPEDRIGAAAIAGEMLFRGIGNMTSRDAADAMDRAGLIRSMSVGQRFVSLSASCVSNRFDRACELLTMMVRQPRFDADAIEPARQLCLAELAALADSPDQRASMMLSRLHNQVPINRSTLGTEEGLIASTKEDVQRGWQTHAKPRGSILAIAGDVDLTIAQNALEKLLGDWQGASPELTLGAPVARGAYHHIEEESNQVHIYLAHEAPSESHEDAECERVVSSVLSGGTSSRLFSEVREKRGLCYSVSAMYAPEKTAGKVIAYVGTTPPRAQQSLDVLIGELQKLDKAHVSAASEISEDEFARALVGYVSRLVASGESTGARAGALASDYFRLGRARSLDELIAAARGITIERVNAYLRRRELGPMTIVTLGPSPLAVNR